MSIVATDLPIDFLFFEPGGRPRFFFAMFTSIFEAKLIGLFNRWSKPQNDRFVMMGRRTLIGFRAGSVRRK